ncbi:hypothetical protein [Lysinibacillus sp. NPDC059133]|uniref:hypothetical protein n=1 Tax=Lysinibacillus sp. NPDC059133 TaxID=3346737 RepID=UPI0036781EE8
MTDSDGVMDALTIVCEKFLIYIRKILCEKLNRFNAGNCTFIERLIDVKIIFKKLIVKLITRSKSDIYDNKRRYFEGKIKLTENSLTLLSQSIMILEYIIIQKKRMGLNGYYEKGFRHARVL